MISYLQSHRSCNKQAISLAFLVHKLIRLHFQKTTIFTCYSYFQAISLAFIKSNYFHLLFKNASEITCFLKNFANLNHSFELSKFF